MNGIKLSQQFIMLNKYFGDKLKESRMENVPTVSQEKIADDLGVSRTTIYNYESGYASPPWWFVCVIAKYFGKKLDYYSYFEKGEDNNANFAPENT